MHPSVHLATWALVMGESLATGAPRDAVDYERDVRPLFETHCYRCHGPKEEEGGLRLDDRKRALEGGMHGRIAIVPGKPEDSLVWQYITGNNDDKVIMPPKDKGQRLSAAECEAVKKWIAAGAKWPE